MTDRPSIAALHRLSSQATWLNDHVEEIALALPLLLEIAKAALAYEQAKVDAAVVRHAFAGGSERMISDIARHDADEIRCRDAYRAALAKVAP